MSESNKNISILINRSSGELEWLLPVIYWLSISSFKVNIIFFNKREYDYCTKSKFLSRLLEDQNVRLLSIPDWWLSYYSSLGFFLRHYANLISIFLKIKSRVLRVFNNYKLDFNKENKFKHFIINHFSEVKFKAVFIDNSFYKDVIRNNKPHEYFLKTLNAEKIIIFPHAPTFVQMNYAKPSEKVIPNKRSYKVRFPSLAKKTLIITDSKELTALYQNNRKLNSFHVASPRFQSWWIREVNSNETNETNEKKEFTVLILSKLRGRLFRSFQETPNKKLLLDIISICDKLNIKWKLKLHPRDKIPIIKGILASANYHNLDEVIFSGSIYDISKDFDLCVSIPNSAMLDTVANGVPTIEYFNYSLVNSKGGFEESNLAGLKTVKLCSNPKELSKSLKEYVSNPSELNKLFSSQFSSLKEHFLSEKHAGKIVEELITNYQVEELK